MVQSFECRQMLDTLQMISKASFGGVELILMASRFNETKWIESTWIFPGSSGSCRDFRERDESCRKNPSRNGRIDSGDEPREKKNDQPATTSNEIDPSIRPANRCTDKLQQKRNKQAKETEKNRKKSQEEEERDRIGFVVLSCGDTLVFLDPC